MKLYWLLLVFGFSVNGFAQSTTGQLSMPANGYGRAAALKELQLYHATLLRDKDRMDAEDRRRVLNECGDQIREFASTMKMPYVFNDGVHKSHVVVKNTICEEMDVTVKDNKIQLADSPGIRVVSQPIVNGVGKVLATNQKTKSTFIYEFYLIY